MKRNDFVQMKELDLKELIIKAKAAKSEIDNLIVDKNMKKLKDLKAIFKKRKDLAQILTILRQKQLLEQLTNLTGKPSDKESEVPDKSEKEKSEKPKAKVSKKKTEEKKSGGKK